MRRLLAGESIDIGELEYDLGGFHIGLLATGPEAPEVTEALASDLGMRQMWIPAQEGRIWAWLGSPDAVDSSEIAPLARDAFPVSSAAALGEPAKGLHGWRLSHRQAAAALPMTRRFESHIIRYADVGLLASIERDEVLAHSLRKRFLDPLGNEGDGGSLQKTLRAYLVCGRNVTSAAAALGVNRETVRNRLRVAERKLGRSLDDCAAELEIALRLTAHAGAPSQGCSTNRRSARQRGR